MKYTKRFLILLLCLCFLASCAEAGGESAVSDAPKAESVNASSFVESSVVEEAPSSDLESSVGEESSAPVESSAEETVEREIDYELLESYKAPVIDPLMDPYTETLQDVLDFMYDPSARIDRMGKYDRNSFLYMIELFRYYGGVYSVTHDTLLNDGVYLGREGELFDSCIQHRIGSMLVVVYNIKYGDPYVQNEDCETVMEYRARRHNTVYDADKYELRTSAFGDVYLYTSTVQHMEGSRFVDACFRLDDGRYVAISASKQIDEINYDDMMEFINGLIFTEIELP